MVLGFAATAAVTLTLAIRDRSRLFARIRSEWAQDRQLLPRVHPAFPGEDHGRKHA
jgi:hypothetical protein